MTKQKAVPVSSIKSLKGAAASFPLPLIIKRLDGSEVELVFTAKAMRKTEWAALRDAQTAPAAESAVAVEASAEPAEIKAPEPFSWSDMVKKDMSKVADLITKCAVGWSVTEEFNQESLIELEDMFGGTLGSFLQSYDSAIFLGRVGN
ncbi:phage tail assembly chaperone [Curvibacter sp. HBC28]|uniref:Phage tail assembly chaperone n=1 Tax=Curvibacter microcysteis TaxID=3026419 RepID=A0ABT5MCI9_9BURK|nr:phage tail assembly chaperone [Curvibacter sp. HBC28]MDD0814286.1 phage tail assembly chaperone [Curvibacter sp. HBC28]